MSQLVRGLPVPKRLLELLDSERWKHPGADVIRSAVPCIDDPLMFLTSIDHMQFESGSLDWTDNEWMHEYHGKNSAPRDLPWLDADLAFFVIINAEIGDDVAVALDFRTSMDDPRVVASEWGDRTCYWRQCADTFSEFVRLLEL